MKHLLSIIIIFWTSTVYAGFNGPSINNPNLLGDKEIGRPGPALGTIGDGYNAYALYYQSPSTRDRANRLPLTTTNATAVQDNQGQTVPANTPCFDVINGARKLRGCGVVENFFLAPAAPETQSITLAAGTYTMFCAGTGSVSYDGNEATDGTPVTFTLASETTANATVTGDLNSVQINAGAYCLPLNTTGSAWAATSHTFPVNSGSELEVALDGERGDNIIINGDFSNGLTGWNDPTGSYSVINNQCVAAPESTGYKALSAVPTPLIAGTRYEASIDIISNNGATVLLLNDWTSSQYQTVSATGNHFFVFEASGTSLTIQVNGEDKTVVFENVSCKPITPPSAHAIIAWTPAWDADQVSGEIGILSFDNGTTQHIRYDADNTQLEIYDGTNTGTVALTAVGGTDYLIHLKYDGENDRMKIGYATDGDPTYGTQATFAGSFGIDTNMKVMDDADCQHVEFIKFGKEVAW